MSDHAANKAAYVFPRDLHDPSIITFAWVPRVYHFDCGGCERNNVVKWGIFSRAKCPCGVVNIFRWASGGY